MIHWIDPVLPEVFIDPDYNASDWQTAVIASQERQRIITGYFDGSIAGDTVDDCLAEHGINPGVFWEQASSNIEELILLDPAEIDGLDRLLRNGPHLGT
jgi:hypothetical protein